MVKSCDYLKIKYGLKTELEALIEFSAEGYMTTNRKQELLNIIKRIDYYTDLI